MAFGSVLKTSRNAIYAAWDWAGIKILEEHRMERGGRTEIKLAEKDRMEKRGESGGEFQFS